MQWVLEISNITCQTGIEDLIPNNMILLGINSLLKLLIPKLDSSTNANHVKKNTYSDYI